MNTYNSNFYDIRQAASIRSAEIILPLVLTHMSNCKSVVDIGCANGTWLSVFDSLGVHDYVGIDGDWVNSKQLLIPETRFIQKDLSNEFCDFDRNFDLAVSIEVAEHLPESRAISFVKYLTSLSDYVLFSAAIPGQGGTGHVNEQWQSYWAKLFEKQGYSVLDIIRPKVWDSVDVNIVHAQNILLYSRLSRDNDGIEGLKVSARESMLLDIVHPRLLNFCVQREKNTCLSYRLARKLRNIFT